MALIKGGHGFEPSEKEKPKDRGMLLKKGTVAYEPIPITDYDLRKGADKSIKFLKETVPEAPPVDPREELDRIKEEAQNVVAKAKAESERILAEAQSKAKKLIEQSKLYGQTAHDHSKREGFELGKQEGRAAAFEEFQGLMQSARDILAQLGLEREKIAKSAEQGLAKLAVKIAERVIGNEVSADQNVVLNMVRACLERVKDRDHVILRVNPDDLETVKSKKETFRQFVPGVSAMEIQSDPRVERGGCVVETNLGTVDARISTQLEAIELAFSKYEPPPSSENEPT